MGLTESNKKRSEEAKQRLREQILRSNTQLFGDFYDCSTVDVTGNITTCVQIICPVHGPFRKRIAAFVRGSGCRRCTDSKKQITVQEWKHRAAAKHNNKYDYSLIQSFDGGYTQTIGEIKCFVHGTFKQNLSNHLQGAGCPKCSAVEAQNIKHHKQKSIPDDSLNLLSNEEWLRDQNHTENKTLSDIASTLGVSVSTVWSRFNKYNIPTKHFYTSSGENEIVTFLRQECGVEVEQSRRDLIPPYELDIFIPKHNIAIEFNGNFWHTELNGGKTKNYHRTKTLKCVERGIRLIHIFEYEWVTKRAIIESRLKSLFVPLNRVHARKTRIVVLSPTEKKCFMMKNHLYGDAKSSYNIGLMYNDYLVSVMTFGKPRYTKNYEYELIRFASEPGIVVVGGASKLFKQFITEINPKNVISYADNKWSVGSVYQHLGFKFKGYTKQPGYVYVKPPDFTPIPRHRCQKHLLHKFLPVVDLTLTEWDNMKLHGYDRIWDVGHSIWSYENNNHKNRTCDEEKNV